MNLTSASGATGAFLNRVEQTYSSWSFVNFGGFFGAYLSIETSTIIARGP